jgi:protein-S-isoprenylcysteine O-methyltransferase Ste14
MQIAVLWFRVLLFIGIFGGVLFGTAGRLDIPAFWICWGIWIAFSVVGMTVVMRTDPTLIQERMRPGPGGKDPYLRIFGFVFFTAHWVIAALDVGRYHCSDGVPLAVQAAGIILLPAGLSLSSWSMSVNRFFSSEARIQRDRGHHVITSGPYAHIRHPGYAAAILMTLASPFALGSYVSALATLPLFPLFLRRLFIEERMLLAELEGYAEYAQRVRYRLMPGIW